MTFPFSTENIPLASCQVMCHCRKSLKTGPTSDKVLQNNSATLKLIFGFPFFLFFFFCFLGPHLQEVPRLGVHWSCICDLHHNSWQHQILNPLSKARVQTHILMDTSQVYILLSHNGNSCFVWTYTNYLLKKISNLDN